MPITINGSGTIAGLNAGGLPDACITTNDLAANAVTTPKLGTNEQSQLCKAWVNFAGDGTVAIRASYNVSSITDNGTGDYTVNFATALVDANYSLAISSGTSGIGNNGRICQPVRTAPLSSAARVFTQDFAGNGFDSDYTYVAIFR